MISKLEADEVDWRVEKDIKLTHDLMCKFGIDPKKNNAYRRLAIALAWKHYPNGVRRVGRPKRQKNVLQELFVEQKKCRKLGRPPVNKESRETLLRLVERVITERGLKGRGSDKKALEILIDDYAKDTKKSKLRMREKHLKPWQKELSRARRT